ncbi:MAG: hypothetical protein BJ554DRAFT_2867 [Olpidium bornovanus]|uniref:Secreted protein n=1 Tax=Olpidium bornovanus TaxID=278681 RepID=A0A8H7ZPU5_9FUNG|nr:MAG: hypothetical protein BJ554DRAFT_2867 [Olpidium bornovanus]
MRATAGRPPSPNACPVLVVAILTNSLAWEAQAAKRPLAPKATAYAHPLPTPAGHHDAHSPAQLPHPPGQHCPLSIQIHLPGGGHS